MKSVRLPLFSRRFAISLVNCVADNVTTTLRITLSREDERYQAFRVRCSHSVASQKMWCRQISFWETAATHARTRHFHK